MNAKYFADADNLTTLINNTELIVFLCQIIDSWFKTY